LIEELNLAAEFVKSRSGLAWRQTQYRRGWRVLRQRFLKLAQFDQRSVGVT
jgi:hypothetical protein